MDALGSQLAFEWDAVALRSSGAAGSWGRGEMRKQPGGVGLAMDTRSSCLGVLSDWPLAELVPWEPARVINTLLSQGALELQNHKT